MRDLEGVSWVVIQRSGMVGPTFQMILLPYDYRNWINIFILFYLFSGVHCLSFKVQKSPEFVNIILWSSAR